jgi:hypothetical protein
VLAGILEPVENSTSAVFEPARSHIKICFISKSWNALLEYVFSLAEAHI